MKAYKQFVAEAAHHLSEVGEWGVITHEGNHVRGSLHPTATSHAQLGGMHPVEYFQDHMSDEHEDGALAIRTHSLHGLNMAIKHFDQLPHYKHGSVVHEHDGNLDGHVSEPTGSSGKRYKVLANMKKLASRG